MKWSRIFWGELIGTFLLVFFGCGAVASAVLTGAPVGIFQVAIIWGIGIALAIYLVGGLSGAHLNPAITLALVFWKKASRDQLSTYFIGQFTGAFLASVVLSFIFSSPLTAYENRFGIERGSIESVATAMIYGEYYPNPGGKPLSQAPFEITTPQAFGIEFFGTMILALLVFGLTDESNPSRPREMTAPLIGLTVTVLICLLGPMTMACFNPARDLSPRIFSSLAGWGSIPFTINGNGWWIVYLVAPFSGAILGGGLYEKIVRPYFLTG